MTREGTRLVGCFLCVDRMNKRNSIRSRLGISASARYGNAPERNRFKRLVREAFRLHRAQLPAGIEINVLPRKKALKASLSDIEAELLRLLC